MPRYQRQAGSLESGASCFRYTRATKASKSSEKPKTTETSKASETAETAETTNSAGRLVNLEFFGMADSVSSNAALIVHSECPLCDQGYSRTSAKHKRTFAHLGLINLPIFS